MRDTMNNSVVRDLDVADAAWSGFWTYPSAVE